MILGKVVSRMKRVCSVGLDGSVWGVRSELRGNFGLIFVRLEVLFFLIVCI